MGQRRPISAGRHAQIFEVTTVFDFLRREAEWGGQAPFSLSRTMGRTERRRGTGMRIDSGPLG
ncbi:hypothetical protein NITLEN_50087 [Nitrospira lenta]|uniref:Uncharacterized protein n=1 Tax=Nitrospira lenta TaxID=1436998 RepID=A0A330L9T0_9BACT|nr:hypothetical protein NITLEN_50087 [Nitrospira lenta]